MGEKHTVEITVTNVDHYGKPLKHSSIAFRAYREEDGALLSVLLDVGYRPDVKIGDVWILTIERAGERTEEP